MQQFLSRLSESAGVYVMKDIGGSVIYVGKAKNLKKRISSYFHNKKHDQKTQTLVDSISDIEVTLASSEAEALLLENSLINQWKPQFNIIFRDDKSYPYIALTDGDYPQLMLHRGIRKKNHKYFGPYPGVRSVRETIEILQKIFQLRQCDDSYFSNRKRPCLQFQIDRCSAPCVGKVSKKSYADDVSNALKFLKGKAKVVIEQMIADMENASRAMDYEKAARIRNQIQSLRLINQHQRVFSTGKQVDCDVISNYMTDEIICFHVIIIRDGAIVGSRQYLTESKLIEDETTLYSKFIMQQYISYSSSNVHIPEAIIIPNRINISSDVLSALSSISEGKIQIRYPADRVEQDWEVMAVNSAEHAVSTRISKVESYKEKFDSLGSSLGLSTPEKVVCFDVSHLQGTSTIAACVVFNSSGPIKEEYRRYKVFPESPGDDYYSIGEAVTRYFSKLLSFDEELPSIIIIDGGKGQVQSAVTALSSLGLGSISIMGIAKGPERKPGCETVFFADRELNKSDFTQEEDGFHLLLEIRDEAHRFAITGHRKARARNQTMSFLENIHGIGPKKRQDLLKYFGGLQGLVEATENELQQVPGISDKLAKRLYSEIRSAHKK